VVQTEHNDIEAMAVDVFDRRNEIFSARKQLELEHHVMREQGSSADDFRMRLAPVVFEGDGPRDELFDFKVCGFDGVTECGSDRRKRDGELR